MEIEVDSEAVMKCPVCRYGTVYRNEDYLICERCGAEGETAEDFLK